MAVIHLNDKPLFYASVDDARGTLTLSREGTPEKLMIQSKQELDDLAGVLVFLSGNWQGEA